ncbi:alternative sulfate transporter [Ophiostoma piceae UAMH 11346]|uniref:Alternative sulfate transporter n=1 Tax=Ophiostoma piceae (strain UAMH 11346) TaxID=1262450 RepID=S3C7I4_OPHP1|nr:alternative sulfate transporter [Ophiostoma piceae UAMH 11346]
MGSIKPQKSEPLAVYQDNEEALHHEVDWTPAEELRAKRKYECLISDRRSNRLPELDRGNISNAITNTFMQDVGIDQNQFNVGQQMLSLGIVLFEIPSNMLLYRVGPGKWLTLQLFLFGIVSTFQAFQRGYSSFIATRFLLGVTESGFIPGGLWTLSTWYTRTETAKRVMIFYFGNQIGQASSKLLAYGILHMDGVGGKPGWFWLFTIMGVFTCCGGVVFGFLLPDSFRDPRASFPPRLQLFSERELHILQTRVLLDDPMKGKRKKKIGKAAFRKAFTNWRLWVHTIISLCNNGPQRAFDTYSPTIVSGFGFPKLTSNAMASVGLWLQVPVSFAFSYVSDYFNLRPETVIAGLSCHLIGNIFNRGFTEYGDNRKGVKYFGIVWTQTFATFSHPLNIAWMSLTCDDSEERALAMAMVIMAANTAGIYGAQIFRQDDKPKYRRGFSINLGVLAFGLAMAILRKVDQLRQRRRQRTASTDSNSDGLHHGYSNDEAPDKKGAESVQVVIQAQA